MENEINYTNSIVLNADEWKLRRKELTKGLESWKESVVDDDQHKAMIAECQQFHLEFKARHPQPWSTDVLKEWSEGTEKITSKYNISHRLEW